MFDKAKDEQKGQRTVLGFLTSYRFTTQESTPDDQSVDPDPELLGKVFENLYQGDERHDTGAYYTPREIVHYMCRQALDGYLQEQTGVSQETLDWLRQEAIDWEASDRLLDPTTQEALHHALDNVSILDPAVGSGAFLIGSMQEIVLLRRGLEMSRRTTDIDPTELDVAEWKRRAITQSLHGVDINPMAVEICKLRLWLSLAIDQDPADEKDLISLPDLDFRIVAGDSLVDRMGAEPFIQSLPDPKKGGWQPRLDIQTETNRLQNSIRGLKNQFTGEAVGGPAEKRRLARRIRKAEVAIARVQLDEALERARGTLTALEKNTRATAKARKDAQAHLDGLEGLEQGLRENASFQKPFLWPVNFHEVMERGGFDIVLANPPYVRQEKLDPVDQESYSHAFKGAATGTADLYVYFYARALQVLRSSGQMAFITSNKFFKADYGGGLRGLLAESARLRAVLDFGHIPVFDADVMPTVLTGRKDAPPPQSLFDFARLREPLRVAIVQTGSRVNVDSVREALTDLPTYLHRHQSTAVQAELSARGWAFMTPTLARTLDRLSKSGRSFASASGAATFRGLLTGLNEAFVLDSATAQRLSDEDPRCREVMHSWTRGQDVGRWKIGESGQSVVVFQNSGDADAQNPWGAAKGESEARAIFQQSFPGMHRHLSNFENEFVAANGKRKPGLRPRADQGRWWWELRACVYYSHLRRPKMVWKDIGYVPHFAWDDSGSYLANTCFFSSSAPKWLAAVCNSAAFEWLATPSLMEGKDAYFRWLPSDLAEVPVPGVTEEQAQALERLADRAAAADQTDLHTIETEVDEFVADLYGLTAVERHELRQWKEMRMLAETVESIRAGMPGD